MSDDAPSITNLENLAEEQSRAIKELETKLAAIEKENEKLAAEAEAQETELSKKENDAIQRLVVGEFQLAHAKTVLSMYGRKPPQDSGKRGRAPALDPTVDLIYRKAHEAAQEGKKGLQQSFDDLVAWKFTPDSASGKRLMACMRQLLERNKTLGAINQMDRLQSLEAETQMQASCIREYTKTTQELNAVYEELMTDLEGVQCSLFAVKKQLNSAESLITSLKEEYEKVNPGQSDALIAAALATYNQQVMAAANDSSESNQEIKEEPMETEEPTLETSADVEATK